MTSKQQQLDLFVAIVGEVPFRDDREMMSAPMVSLAKRSPAKLEWKGPSGQQVLITAGTSGSIATIYDFDIVIWAVSQLNAAVDRTGKPPSATITFRPYDLLKAIGRGTSGRDYEAFKKAIDRLRTTRIQTTIRRHRKDRMEDFNLLADFTLDEDEQGRPLGAQLTVPRWIHRAVVEGRDVLAIAPGYFDLSSGLDRFLYRLARRHAGNGRDNPNGWAFSFRDLHSRTGSPAPYGQFARDLRKAIARDALPTYTMTEEEGANGPLLRLQMRELGKLLNGF
jgi:plasmid replication initiation protein